MMFRTILTIVFVGYLAPAIAQNELEKVRGATLENLRDFRRQVIKSDLGVQGDSLLSMLASLIEMARRTNHASELKDVSSYVANCTDAFSNASKAEKEKIAQSINKDLQLKAREDDRFAMEGNRGFGSNVKITVLAQIDGVAIKGSYRLYWGYYLGRNVSKLIEAGLSQGSSDNYNNPYDLTVRVPGYICFWLKDEQANKYYLANFDYKVLDPQSKNLTINFQPQN